MPRVRDVDAPAVVHRVARVGVRPTAAQARRLWALLVAGGDVWACVLELNGLRRRRGDAPLVGYAALCRELSASGRGTFGELDTVGARSVLRRYSDAWFTAAKARRAGHGSVRFPRRKRRVMPLRWYAGTFHLDGQRLQLPTARGAPPLRVRLARPVPGAGRSRRDPRRTRWSTRRALRRPWPAAARPQHQTGSRSTATPAIEDPPTITQPGERWRTRHYWLPLKPWPVRFATGRHSRKGVPRLGEMAISESSQRLPPGRRIEVRCTFDASWARGFEVVEAVSGGYTVRRLSDGCVLPAVFADDDVRRERKQGQWWY
jgi:hypothetical protein